MVSCETVCAVGARGSADAEDWDGAVVGKSTTADGGGGERSDWKKASSFTIVRFAPESAMTIGKSAELLGSVELGSVKLGILIM